MMKIDDDIKANVELERLFDAIHLQDDGLLMVHAKRLKQTDGEGWSIGELAERAVKLRAIRDK